MSLDSTATDLSRGKHVAYAAGLVDGEGCVYVGLRDRDGVRYYLPILEVGMTGKAKALLLGLQSMFGGSVRQMRAATKRWGEAFHWRIWGDPCVDALRELLPHMHLKKEQARLAMLVGELRRSLIPEGKTRAEWTSDARDRCETIRLRIQELNRKGPEVPPSEPPMTGARIYAHRVAGEWVRPQGDLLSDTGWAKLSGSWPAAGITRNGVVWMLNTGESHSGAVACSLSDILEKDPVPARYFLSPKAAAGILRRAERRGRELPPALRQALMALASTDLEDTRRTT